MRIVAVDYGMARIGLAISDPTQTIATPLPTLKSSGNPQKAAQLLADALKSYTFSEVVVGLPLKLSGQDSDTTTLVRKFIEELQKLLTVPVIAFDERLTTVQADRALREGQYSRKSRAQMVDQATALLLLTNYLELKKR